MHARGPRRWRHPPSIPLTRYLWSKTASISSWLVSMHEREMETIERCVCWASALMSEVCDGGGGGEERTRSRAEVRRREPNSKRRRQRERRGEGRDRGPPLAAKGSPCWQRTLPVPGGPCRSKPSLCGYPLTA